ncbi:MAG: ABC transporter ATP-binding protein [Pelolinea sp.]|nr:ABC transporter ATP-binding protein [Pelolinea sp.]
MLKQNGRSDNTLDLKRLLSEKRLAGLWRLMDGFQYLYIAAIAAQGFSAYSKTATFLLLSYFVDNYIAAQIRPYPIWLIVLSFVLFIGLQGLFTYISGRLAAKTSENTIRRLRNYLFDQIQHLPFSYHSETDTGELISRCTSDVDALRRFYNDQAIGIGRISLLFIVNFIALLNLNTKLGLISVIVVPFILGVSIFFFRKVSVAYEAYQEQDAILSTTLQENLSGVRVVKAFARQPYEITKFEKNNWEKFQRGKKLLTIHSQYWPISDVLCGVQLLTGYLVGALMTINGEISVGNYLAYAGLVIYIIYPLRGLGRFIVQMSNALVSYDRVYKIIKEDREPIDEGDQKLEKNINGEITFKHVGFEYEHNDRVLHDISFHADAGQVVALLGSTGSGKTSLVNLLPRFYDFTSGEILLDGQDLRLFSRRFLRKEIGIVEQEPFLFSRSIKENISYGVDRDISQEEIEQAARMAAVHDVILTFPGGYDTLVGERGVTLSGGQKQRIAIARTLLKDPCILIFDDSTSSVDTETESQIRSAMETLMKNRTTFIIAHRIQSIMAADLILVMEQGRIVQKGKHADLVKEDGIYQQIFNIQTRVETELDQELSNAG